MHYFLVLLIFFFLGCSSKDIIYQKEYQIEEKSTFTIINPLKDPIHLDKVFMHTLQKYNYSGKLAHENISTGNTKKLTQGSGFFLNKEGYVVTNHHVIENLNEVFIQLQDKKNIPAKVLFRDKLNDLALLKPIKNYQPTYWFNILNKKPLIGSNINVIGYPLTDVLGSDVRITQGIVSSEKGIKGDNRQFQISAPIQPGNSGGPIINSQLELVGIATARLSDKYLLEYMNIIPQNINFGVTSIKLHQLLKKYNINNPKSNITTLQDATKATVLVHNSTRNSRTSISNHHNMQTDYTLSYEYIYHWEFDSISYLTIKLSRDSEELAFVKYTGDSLSSPSSIAEELLLQILNK